MKYLKLYSDKSWMESVALRGKPNTIELTDEEFAQIGVTKRFENGVLIDIPQAELETMRLARLEYEQQLQKQAEIDEIQRKISEIKAKLSETDYQAIKYAEGFISEADYVQIKAPRQAWRDEINALETELASKKVNNYASTIY